MHETTDASSSRNMQSALPVAVSAPGRTPVAFVVFNRPRHTQATFAPIRAYRPAQLFLIADGPRADHPEDVKKCAEVRRIVSQVDWSCEIRHNFSDTNLGCGRRVSSGLTWVFSAVDRAIVLEDDCLASSEFFAFCDALLERYRDERSVWVINGNSYQPEFRRGDGTYYFSKYPDIWGWATWRRSWQHYQQDLPFLAEWKRSRHWRECFPARSERRHFERVFREALSGAVDTWDYQWVGCVIHAGGLCATPNANLVKNIGFDIGGTHTTAQHRHFAYDHTPLGSIIHPSRIEIDHAADEYHRLAIRSRGVRSIATRLGNWLSRALSGR